MWKGIDQRIKATKAKKRSRDGDASLGYALLLIVRLTVARTGEQMLRILMSRNPTMCASSNKETLRNHQGTLREQYGSPVSLLSYQYYPYVLQHDTVATYLPDMKRLFLASSFWRRDV